MEFGLGADVCVLKVPMQDVSDFETKYHSTLELKHSLENEASVFYFVHKSDGLFKLIKELELEKEI